MSPLALGATLLAVAGSTVAAGRVARHLASELPPFGRGALAMGLAISGFLTVLPWAGRVLRDLDAALVALAICSITAAVIARRWTRDDPPVQRPPLDWAFAIAVLLVLAVYGWVAFRYQMHDEHPIFGHKAMIEQLRRGEYPPYFPPIPEQDARYHYGFDVLAGVLARAFGLSADLAIDLTTLLLVLFTSWAAAAIIAELGGRAAAAFGAIAIHFGAGLAWLLLAGVEGRWPRCLVQYHHPSCSSELFPTPFLNIFQHPVSVGVPFLLVSLLAARGVFGSDAGRARLWCGLSLLLFPALALGQIVYFALGSLGLLAALPFMRPAQLSRAGRVAAVLAVSLGLAWLAGGMLTPSAVTESGLVVFRSRPGFPEPNLGVIARHHSVNLGLGFLLFPLLAITAIVRGQLVAIALAAAAAGGMIAPHFFNYTRSWDIVKFPSASAFMLTLLYVAFADARMIGLGWPWSWLRRGGRTLLLGSGVLAAVFVSFPLAGEYKLYDLGDYQPDERVKATIDWWRARDYRREELIYAQSNVAQELSVFGGLSVVGGDYDFVALGIKDRILAERSALLAQVRSTMSAEALDRLGVHWVMLSVQELDNVGPRARAALVEPALHLELVATFEDPDPQRTRKIWRVSSTAKP